MKYAMIFPGNLSSFYLCIDNYKKICDEFDIDVYILYSNNNYVHTLAGNENIEITNEDITIITQKLGDHIKYFSNIDNNYEYKNFISEQISYFQNKIVWTKNMKLFHGFNYEDFMNLARTTRYIDQFVRINYLYKVILNKNINYDYIIRARIDQYIQYELFKNLIEKLNICNKIYPIVTISLMDNFFLIGKYHYNFFNFITNNIGSKDLLYININEKYILGPEVQFNSLVNTFFKEQSTDISDIINCRIYISFAIFDNIKNIIYFYSHKKTGMNFSEYIRHNQINSNNFDYKIHQHVEDFKQVNINFTDIPIKYLSKNLVMFYTILLHNYVN